MPIGFERTMAVRVESEGVDAFESDIGRAKAKLLEFRRAVGLAGGAVSALATGALVAAANEARQFEQAMVEVEKVTNPETAREMSDSIREMAETIPLAQQELAQIAADAGRFGIQGSENIESFTRSVAKMATATNLSAGEAGEALARLSTLTGVPIENVENLGSVINELSNNMATSSQEIVDSMLRSSASLEQLGLSAEQISGLSASLNAVSESSERAGTRLRRLGQELMDPDTVGDLAQALGMTREEFIAMREQSPNDLILRMAEAFEEGGEQADRMRSVLSTPTRQALAGMSQNLDGVSRSLDMANRQMEAGTSLQREYAAATDTFNARLQTARNRLANEAITIGNALLPALNGATGAVSGYLDSSDTLLAALSAQEKAWGLVAVAIAGAGAAGWAFIGGPMTALIAASAALTAAWISDWADIRSTTFRSLAAIGQAYSQTIGGMQRDTEDSGNAIMGWIDRFTTAAAQGFDSLAVGVVTFVDSVFFVAGQFMNVLDAMVESVVNLAETIKSVSEDGEVSMSELTNELDSQWEETVSNFQERSEQMTEDFVARLDERRTEAASRSRVRQGQAPIPGTDAAAENRETAGEDTPAVSSSDVQAQAAAFESAVGEAAASETSASAPSASAPVGQPAGAGGGVRRGGGVIGVLSPSARERLGEAAGGGGPRRITEDVFSQLAERGGVTPDDIGVSRQQFRRLTARFTGGPRIGQPMPGGGTGPVGAGAGGGMAAVASEFSASVSEFGQAVDQLVNSLPLDVIVDVRADELEQMFRAWARDEAQGVQQEQARADTRVGIRGRR